MEPLSRAWIDGLRGFVAEHRATRRPPAWSADETAAVAERTILGTAIAARLPELDRLRESRRGIPGADPDAVVVLTTSAAGMLAIDRMVEQGGDTAMMLESRVIPVSELEYRLWCIRQPDEMHRHHVNLWSWVKTRVPTQRWAEFAAFPIRQGEAYWLHREGLAGGGDLNRRASHLWRWDGHHASLLKAFIEERSVPHLGAHQG